MFRSNAGARATSLGLLVASVALVAACSAPAGTTNPTVAATPVSTAAAPTASPTATPTVTPAASTTARAGIGTKVLVGDQQYVTVTLVEQWPDTDALKPATGNVFVTVNIRIDAITTTSFTSVDFSAMDSSGHVYPSKTGRAPNLSFQNGLTPNTYYAGFVTFEVPLLADPTDLSLIYAPNFLTTTYEIILH